MFENKRLILTVLALLVVGFSIEYISGVDGITTRDGQRLSGADYANIDSRNFMRSDRSKDKAYAVDTSKKRPFKLSGVKSNMGEYDANGPKAKGKLKKKKKKKKKKAKKKKPRTSDEYEVVVYEEAKRPESPVEEEADKDFGGSNGGADVQDEEDSIVYDEWAKRLLLRPDRSETIVFIREFQSGKIKADVFYRIVEEMYLKDITEFRSLAVLCAGAVPSMRSYNFLVKAFSEDTSPNIRSEATAELRDYNILQHLWIPRGIIAAPTEQNTVSATIAANAIDTASATYLTPQARTGEDSAPGVDSVFRNYFLALIPILETAIERYQSTPEVATPLTNALTRIQQLGVVAFNEEF